MALAPQQVLMEAQFESTKVGATCAIYSEPTVVYHSHGESWIRRIWVRVFFARMMCWSHAPGEKKQVRDLKSRTKTRASLILSGESLHPS